jgi:hypothetical protein
MSYRNAENCRRCPQRNDEHGCPWWWELMEANVATGEERLTKGCGKALLPRLMVEVIKASNRPAAAVESCRNEIAGGFAQVVAAMPALVTIGRVERPPALDVTVEPLALPEGAGP